MDRSLSLKTAGRYLRYGLVGALMLTVLPARAASVTFFLDQSNVLPDGNNYLSVMLTENASSGVDFLVQTLNPLNDVSGRNFGIQKFSFGFVDGFTAEVDNLPNKWRSRSNRRMSEFGKFDIRLQGRGRARTDSLSFTVNNSTLGDFSSLMAAHVAGFEWCDLNEKRRGNWCRDCVTSAYFSGRMGEILPPDPTAVPLPAAAWLFGSGLLGLMGVARRKRA